MKDKKVYIGGFKNETIHVYSVDGVHSSTRECKKNPTAKVYSHKFHGPGVTYRVGIAIFESRMPWIKDHLLLQRMIPEYAEVKVGLMMISYKEKGGLLTAYIEKLSR